MKHGTLLACALVMFGCDGAVAVPDDGPEPSAQAPIISEPAPSQPGGTFTEVPQHEEDDAPLRIASTSQHGVYLTDREGQPLYMYVGDTAGARVTACLAECAHDWPPFDADALRVGSGIEPREVARFHRQDGQWQTTYKGFPLYRRASELGAREVTGDGFAGRWFVAKDYLTFLSLPVNFEPAGSGDANAGMFLTDGYGRTLYVCLDDKRADAAVQPETSCTGDCIATRPPLSIGATQRTTVLPASIDARDLRAYTRPDGAAQLTYRGWPLYYFAGDARAGDTTGHNQKAWRAIDPRGFGLAQPTPRRTLASP